jgi:translation elongation factor EF-Tu-like GTPase
MEYRMPKIFGFTDVIEPRGEGNGTVLVQARVHFLSTTEGGKAGSVTGRYRPNHNFGPEENRSFYIGQLQIPEGKWIQPGETIEVEVAFFNVGDIKNLLTSGRRWRIQEGQKLVANAEVLSIID